jgi:hypothetical protein
VKEKSYEESLALIKEEYAKKLEVAKNNEAKLQEKLTALEKRNVFL